MIEATIAGPVVEIGTLGLPDFSIDDVCDSADSDGKWASVTPIVEDSLATKTQRYNERIHLWSKAVGKVNKNTANLLYNIGISIANYGKNRKNKVGEVLDSNLELMQQTAQRLERYVPTAYDDIMNIVLRV